MRRRLTKRLITAALVGFCALMILDWTGLTGRHFPANWAEALIQICVNIAWTVMLTVAFYFINIRPAPPASRDEKKQGPMQVQQSDRNRWK